MLQLYTVAFILELKPSPMLLQLDAPPGTLEFELRPKCSPSSSSIRENELIAACILQVDMTVLVLQLIGYDLLHVADYDSASETKKGDRAITGSTLALCVATASTADLVDNELTATGRSLSAGPRENEARETHGPRPPSTVVNAAVLEPATEFKSQVAPSVASAFSTSVLVLASAPCTMRGSLPPVTTSLGFTSTF